MTANKTHCADRKEKDMEKPEFTAKALDYTALCDYLGALCDCYGFVHTEYIGETILTRPIPCAVLGEGKTEFLYVSGHHASEWITGLSLLRFLYEMCEAFVSRRKMYGADAEYILREKKLCVIPLLNIDGAEMQIHGIEKSNPLFERVIKMNAGSNDFTHWQANARGVDLNHNYNAGFAEYKQIEAENGIPCGAPTKYSGPAPESEPECSALVNFIRAHDLRSLVSLHTQGEEIYYSTLNCCPVSARTVAAKISSLTGYKTSAPSGSAAYGGLIDWFISEYDRPAFTLECGKGENPLPLDDEMKIYMRLRKFLFTFPLML